MAIRFDAFGAEMWGKPFLEISDDDIATATRAYRDCIAKLNVSLGPIVGKLQPSPQFEPALRNAVMAARNVDNQKKAQQVDAIELRKAQLREQARRDEEAAEEAVRLQAAQIEVEKAEAQRKREQAEAQRKQEQLREQAQRDKEAAEEAARSAELQRAQAEETARRKQEQLRERARRDREAAEEALRFAEREEPKIAEATREAEEALHARQAAEQRLAEIRSRIEAQENARKEALAKSQATEAARQQEIKRETERDKAVASPGVLDELDAYKKRHSSGDNEAGLAAMLSYNAICKGITPEASSNMLEAYTMMAMLLGVDINDPATKARVADIGKVLIVGYNLGLGGPGNSKTAHCKETYDIVAKFDQTMGKYDK